MNDTLLDAWLDAIAHDGWSGARLDSVARAAGVSAGEVAAVLPDRWSALDAFSARLDRTALADAGDDPDASVRDRLFTLLMARFDAAERHKPAVLALTEAVPLDPGLTAWLLARGPRAVGRLAEAAGVDTAGWLGPLRVQALSLLAADVARTWLRDGSTDLAATMKALDERLGQAERLAGVLSRPIGSSEARLTTV